MSLVATGITLGGVATAGAIVTGAATAGRMIAGAFGAQSEEEAAEQRAAAQGLFQERKGQATESLWDRMNLLHSQRYQAVAGATQQAALGKEIAQSQFVGGQRDITMGTQTGYRDIKAGGAEAVSRSGLVQGTAQRKVGEQTKDLLVKAKSDMTKLFDTRALAQKERDLKVSTTQAEANLAYRSGELSSQDAFQSSINRAEDVYQNTLTDISSQPTGPWEGMFS